VARNILLLIFCATMSVILGLGYYNSFRSGSLTVKGRRTSRRDHEPIAYWIGMLIGILGFLVMVSGTALMAFLVFVDLRGH
jgi:hypothetical protein